MTVTVVVTALFWVVVVARLRTVRRDARRRMLWAHLLCCAVSLTIALPALLAGRHAPLAAHLCGVLAAHLLLRFISLVTGAGRPWAQWTLALAVLTFLTIGPTRDDAAYWAVFEGYLALVLTSGAVAYGRIGRAAPAGLLRVGLLAMSAGLLLIALYATGTVLLNLAPALHPVLPPDLAGLLKLPMDPDLPVEPDLPVDPDLARAGETPIAPWLVVLRRAGVLLYLTGASVPAAVRLRAVLSAYRSLVVLRPLWSAMRRAFPEVVLVAPARAALEMTGETGVRLRVYRRVIEIRDGMLALRAHLPPGPPPEGPDRTTTAGSAGGPTSRDPMRVDSIPADPMLAHPMPADPMPADPTPADPTPAHRARAHCAQPGPTQTDSWGAGPGLDPAAAEARAIAVALQRRAAGEPPVDPPGQWAPVGPAMADEVAWLSAVSRAFKAQGRASGRVRAFKA